MKIVSRKQQSLDLVESIMFNRGVHDIPLYLNPTHENDTNPCNIPHIQECINIVRKNIGKRITILVDSDADGNSSAAIIYKYLKFVNPLASLSYYVHERKTHGITNEFLNYVKETHPDLVIVVDGGTNDIENREKIVSLGIDLIIIDHHNEDKHTDNGGILINNHAFYPKNNINKNLTGSGMTYIVCKAMDILEFHTNRYEELRDLAMIGIIGDCAGVLDNETRVMCLSGLHDIRSKMIKAVIAENNQDINTVTLGNMQWGGIIPLINAVVRVGTLEDRHMMFRALADIETNYFTVIQKRKLNKETRKYEMVDFKLDAYQLAIESAKECKNRQQKIVEKEMKGIDAYFDPHAGIQIYEVRTDECKSLTGLLANKLTSIWEQPVLCVWKLNDNYIGSLRGWEKSLPSMKKWCEDTELFSLVQGHDNAAGVVFKIENFEKIKNMTYNIVCCERCVEVDKLYEKSANIDDIYKIHRSLDMFKNGVDEPIFGVVDLPISVSNAKWSKNTMRVYIDGVTYIKFKVSEEEFNELINIRDCKIDVIGKFSVNEWKGKYYPQMIIEDYDISEHESKSPIEELLSKKSSADIDFGIFK